MARVRTKIALEKAKKEAKKKTKSKAADTGGGGHH